MMALLQWAEFAPEYEDNVTTAIVGHLGAQYARMVDPDGTVLCCWQLLVAGALAGFRGDDRVAVRPRRDARCARTR